MENEMKDERKKTIYIIIAIVAFCIVFSGNIYNSTQSWKYRKYLDTAREQLIAAEEYNRELAERFRSISTNVCKLRELADRNVNGVRECIEIIEETRAIAKEMEDSIYGSDSIDSYYNYWDSYYRNEGLME